MKASHLIRAAAVVAMTFFALACTAAESSAVATGSSAAVESREGLASALFAGGCFWCMEPPFDKVDGVVATISGYTAGEMANPTYKQVSSGATKHTEAIEIVYDPDKVSYEELLKVFWVNVDPLSADGQFCDRGLHYRPGIYYANEEQKQLAEASKRHWEESGRFQQPIVVEIEAASPFYRAEEYHQDFYKKNPAHYKRYRYGCRRDARLKELWGDLAGD